MSHIFEIEINLLQDWKKINKDDHIIFIDNDGKIKHGICHDNYKNIICCENDKFISSPFFKFFKFEEDNDIVVVQNENELFKKEYILNTYKISKNKYYGIVKYFNKTPFRFTIYNLINKDLSDFNNLGVYGKVNTGFIKHLTNNIESFVFVIKSDSYEKKHSYIEEQMDLLEIRFLSLLDMYVMKNDKSITNKNNIISLNITNPLKLTITSSSEIKIVTESLNNSGINQDIGNLIDL